LDSKCLRDAIRDGLESVLREHAVQRSTRHLKRVSRLVEQPRPRIARHREDASLARRPRHFHHVSQCVLRKSGAVLDAVEALLFRSR
jgi:hypothetical protein